MKRIKIISITIAVGFVILLSSAVKSDTTPESPIQLDVNQIAKSPLEDSTQNSIESRVCELEKKVKILTTQVRQLQQLKGQQQDEGLDKQTALQKELKERKRLHQVELAEKQKEIDLKLKAKKDEAKQNIDIKRMRKTE